MMLFHSLQSELTGKRARVVVSVFAASLANVLIIALVNNGVTTIQKPSPRVLAAFAFGLVVYAISMRVFFAEIATAIERYLRDARVRLSSKIQRADYREVERLGSADVHEQLTQNMSVISGTTDAIANVPFFAVLIAFNALYLLAISPVYFVVTIGILLFGMFHFALRTGALKSILTRIAETRVRFLSGLMDLRWGIKEVKLNRRRGDDLAQDIGATASPLRDASIEAVSHAAQDDGLAQFTRYAALGVAAFILPHYYPEAPHAQAFMATLLLVFSPLLFVVRAYPALLRASAAAERLAMLEQTLDEVSHAVPAAEVCDPWDGKFRKITAKDVSFHYATTDGESFCLGPLSFSIAAGQAVFIAGGNGSGKTTLLKLLNGLYTPSSGSIEVDDVTVEPANIQAYREMIAAVFSDFHLFKKLYGLPDVEDSAVYRILAQLKLAHRVSFADRRFSTLDLSTGQRKRLALLVSLLEDRPIMSFDEWAADQDPEYRRYFYEQIIPELTRRGKAVIVITHDDRFFHLADVVLNLEGGQLRSVREAVR